MLPWKPHWLSARRVAWFSGFLAGMRLSPGEGPCQSLLTWFRAVEHPRIWQQCISHSAPPPCASPRTVAAVQDCGMVWRPQPGKWYALGQSEPGGEGRGGSFAIGGVSRGLAIRPFRLPHPFQTGDQSVSMTPDTVVGAGEYSARTARALGIKR